MDEQMRAQGPISLAWTQAWQDKRFRIITIVGSILFALILVALPFFFTFIEKRHGLVLNDALLRLIPARDVSIPTFTIIWSMTLLTCVRCVQNPYIFCNFLVCFILLMLSRMISITLVPLDPPVGLIPLRDPLANFFYGGTNVFVTRDLFYSGHTSIQLMMFFTLRKRSDRILALLSTLSIGTLVLIQHIHYTIDVLAAFVFSYLIFRLGKLLTRN